MKSKAIVNSNSDNPSTPPKLRSLKDYEIEVVSVPVNQYDKKLVSIFADHFVREIRKKKKEISKTGGKGQI